MKRFLSWLFFGCLVALLASGLIVSGHFAESESVSIADTTIPVAGDVESLSTQLLDFEIQDGDGQSVITLECFDDDQVGFMNLEGHLVVPQCFTTAYPFYKGLALVGFIESSGQEHFGFINPQAEFVFPPTILKRQLVLNDINSYYRYGWGFPRDHDHGEHFSEERFPLRQLADNKIGFIDSTGEFVIAPQFDSVGGFHEGVSRVCEIFDYSEVDDSNQRCGYVYPDGRWAMPLQLAQASSFYDGIAQVRFPGERGRTVINNKTFEPLVPNVLQSLGHVNTVGGSGWHVDSGLVNVLLPGCRFNSDEEYPFMGPEPPEAPPPPVDEYGEAGYEYWNPGPVTWGYINVEKGGYAIEPRFCDEGFINEEFVDGRAVVRIHPHDPNPSIPKRWQGRLAIIDTTGKVVDSFGKENTPDFLEGWHSAKEGLLAVGTYTRDYANEEIKYGFIDQEGRWAIEPEYSLAENFREGLAIVARESVRGFINPGGQIEAPLQFDSAHNFSQGLASVQDATSEQWGFINSQGKWVIEPRFDVADSFMSSGFAAVKVSNFSEIGLINKQGEYVIQPSSDFDYDFSFIDLGDGSTLVKKGLGRGNASTPETLFFMLDEAGEVLPYAVAPVYSKLIGYQFRNPSLDNDGLEAGLIIVGEELPESFVP